MTTLIIKTAAAATPGTVHCPMCTHNVDAMVIPDRRAPRVKPGQKCPRCHGTLDAAYVMRMLKAA